MNEEVYLYRIDVRVCQFCNSEVNIKSTAYKLSKEDVPTEKRCVTELMGKLKEHFVHCKGYKPRSIFEFKIVASKKTKKGNLTTYSDDKFFQKIIV